MSSTTAAGRAAGRRQVLRTVRDPDDLEADAFEVQLEQLQGPAVVLDHDDERAAVASGRRPGLCLGGQLGRLADRDRDAEHAACAQLAWTQIRPPNSSTMRLVRARPRPVPSCWA